MEEEKQVEKTTKHAISTGLICLFSLNIVL
jgi:hypothetical protein